MLQALHTLFSTHDLARPYLLVILILLIGLSGGLGDTVQITLTGLGDAAATLLLILLEDTDLLKGLHDLAVDGAGGIDVPGGGNAAVLGGTVDLAETADTDGLAEVDVAGDRGGADVEPVNVQRGELLGGTGLDGVNPTWKRSALFEGLVSQAGWEHTRDGELALTLQESAVGVDELLRLMTKYPLAMIPSSEVLRLPRACSTILNFPVYLSPRIMANRLSSR
jgi:hypothetical protein